MTQAVAHILEKAEQLSAPERAELADRIVESLAHHILPDIAAAQITEVCRRIAQVESGEVSLIPGDEALAHVRRIVASAHHAGAAPHSAVAELGVVSRCSRLDTAEKPE